MAAVLKTKWELETNQEVILMVPIGADAGLDQVVAGQRGRGGEKWSDSGRIWKGEPAGLLRAGWRCERKREARVSLRLLA